MEKNAIESINGRLDHVEERICEYDTGHLKFEKYVRGEQSKKKEKEWWKPLCSGISSM